MTLQPTPLQQGVFTDITAFSAKEHYIWSDKIRFKQRYPQTMGGCAQYNSLITFDGVPRAIRQWSQLDGTFTIAVGTHKKVELLVSTTKYDITPFAYIVTGTLGANPFATNVGVTTVTVTHVAHDRAIGDIVEFPNAITLDGIEFSKFAFAVATVPTANTYTIVAYTAATGTTAAGGGANVTFNYDGKTMANNPCATVNLTTTVTVTDVAHGLSTGATVVLSGLSTVNSIVVNGTWPVTVTGPDTYTFTGANIATGTGPGGGAAGRVHRCVNIGAASGLSMRLPSLANWGEDLVFTIGNQSRVYTWDATLGPSARARRVPRLPPCNFIMVSSDDQSLVLFGCSGDALEIQWSDQADYTVITPAATNTAGDKRIIRGSKLVAAVETAGGSLVFTDTAVHSMQFTGGDFVFTVTFMAKTKIAGQNAACERNGNVQWMGERNFYQFNGRVVTMECPIRGWVFGDAAQSGSGLNATERQGVFAGIIGQFGEAIFFYPSSSATYNDRFALCGLDENDSEGNYPWSPGTWVRTAWSDSDIYEYPLGLNYSGAMYKHEYGTSDDGVAMNHQLYTGDIQPDPSGDNMFIGRRVVLDMKLTGNVNFSTRTRRSANASYDVKGPLLLTETVMAIENPYAALHFRGRRLGMIWETPTYTLEELCTEDLLDLITTEDGETILCDGVPKDQTLNLATTWRLGIQSPDIKPDGTR